MSHRICYGHLAIRFPLDILKSVEPEMHRYSDQYLLLELGGDNNLTTYHPVSRREVGSRRWMLSSLGDQWDIVKDACKYGAHCEGGGMRLNGERHTSPESYIRRIRSVLKSAVSFDDAVSMGFSLSATLTMDPASERGKAWAKAAELLTADVQRSEEGGLYRWTLYPLHSLHHAAHLFVRSNLDTSDPWNFAKVDGPDFDFDQVLKSFQRQQHSLNFAA